ncbi:hypothetical protein DdX_03182 [Ditylenchus destructor]|uniref:Uncharacterized protein n=1 Tax=Ditylenchus destructor TaxID=166010 RepID=A0AAD4NFE7_9BILA|nr:hypothetical protein DdX_03182 [Ditylenchus destructor]
MTLIPYVTPEMSKNNPYRLHNAATPIDILTIYELIAIATGEEARAQLQTTKSSQAKTSSTSPPAFMMPVMATVGWEELGMIGTSINDDNSVWPRPSLTGIF